MKYLKLIIVVFFLAHSPFVLAEVTLDSILNQELVDTALAEILPYRDASTPEKAFLGYLRAAAGTSRRDNVYWLVREARDAHFGNQIPTDISDEQEREYELAVEDWGRYSFKLKSYQITTNGNGVHIDAITSFTTKRVWDGAERHILRATQIDGEWKFDQRYTYSGR